MHSPGVEGLAAFIQPAQFLRCVGLDTHTHTKRELHLQKAVGTRALHTHMNKGFWATAETHLNVSDRASSRMQKWLPSLDRTMVPSLSFLILCVSTQVQTNKNTLCATRPELNGNN